MEFPALVYRSASVHLQVQDEAEHAAALAAGWFATVPEALAGEARAEVLVKPANPDPDAMVAEAMARIEAGREMVAASIARHSSNSPEFAAMYRADLEKKAHKLGIDFSPRLGTAKLAARVAEAERAAA